MSATPQPSPASEPLLPRVSISWFFIAVSIVAVALLIIRAADQGKALAAAIAFTGVFALVTALISGACFVFAFLFGAIERAVRPDEEPLGNPFIDGSPPEQMVPPKPSEGL